MYFELFVYIYIKNSTISKEKTSFSFALSTQILSRILVIVFLNRFYLTDLQRENLKLKANQAAFLMWGGLVDALKCKLNSSHMSIDFGHILSPHKIGFILHIFLINSSISNEKTVNSRQTKLLFQCEGGCRPRIQTLPAPYGFWSWFFPHTKGFV